MYITRFCGPTSTYVYSKISCMYTCIFLQMGTELQLSSYTITFEKVWLQNYCMGALYMYNIIAKEFTLLGARPDIRGLIMCT